jgi:spore coat protein A
MKITRRSALKAAATGLILPLTESACTPRRPEARVLPSRIALPRPFETELPIIPVLPVSIPDSVADYYDLTVRPARATIIPGTTTGIWGYNGIFPGPVIHAQRGRRVVLRLRNGLPVPSVNHLHGGHTPPESDGYPLDFVLPGAVREYVYPNEQRSATLWYHEHRMDFTGAQVWRGLAGFYILHDDEEKQLPLPAGHKEIALAICDRSFDADGSLQYPSLDASLKNRPGVAHQYMGGVFGDVILVNGAPWPRLDVANVKYRLRFLNASNARRYELAFEPALPFIQIGGDGGLLAVPAAHRTLRIAPAERFDAIVDFARFAVGTEITLLNRAATGPAGQVMRFHVTHAERDDTSIPAKLSDVAPPDPAEAILTRTFDFAFGRKTEIWTINGKPFDPNRMDAQPRLNTTEIWRLRTDFSHPLHLHLVHFRVLSHSGRPGPWDAGYKDTIDLAPGEVANILVKFTGYRGRYVFHCHNLEHEDMAMMANFEVV